MYPQTHLRSGGGAVGGLLITIRPGLRKPYVILYHFPQHAVEMSVGNFLGGNVASRPIQAAADTAVDAAGLVGACDAVRTAGVQSAGCRRCRMQEHVVQLGEALDHSDATVDTETAQESKRAQPRIGKPMV